MWVAVGRLSKLPPWWQQLQVRASEVNAQQTADLDFHFESSPGQQHCFSLAVLGVLTMAKLCGCAVAALWEVVPATSVDSKAAWMRVRPGKAPVTPHDTWPVLACWTDALAGAAFLQWQRHL